MPFEWLFCELVLSVGMPFPAKMVNNSIFSHLCCAITSFAATNAADGSSVARGFTPNTGALSTGWECGLFRIGSSSSRARGSLEWGLQMMLEVWIDLLDDFEGSTTVVVAAV
jgi:hypothetical protein